MADIFSIELAVFVPLFLAVVVYLVNIFWKDDDKDLLIYFSSLGLLGGIVLLWHVWMVDGGISKFLIILLYVFSTLTLLLSHNNYHVKLSEKVIPAPDRSPGQASAGIQDRNVASFLVFVLFLTFGFSIALSTTNLLQIFAGLLVVSTSVAFLGKEYGFGIDRGSLQKVWIYLIVTDLLFAFGAVFFFGATGSFDIGREGALLGIVNEAHTANFFKMSLAILFVSLFAKMALVPVHWWLERLSVAKSIPFIGVVLFFCRAGMVLVALKIFAPIASLWGAYLATPIFLLALVTIGWGNLLVVRSKDLKSLVLYSSLAYFGYIILIFPALSILGGSAKATILITTIVFVVAHLGLITMMQALTTDQAEYLDFRSLSGLGRRHPWIAFLISLFLLVLAGVPPFMGFMVRFLVIKELVFGGYYIALIVVALNFAVSMYGYTRPIGYLYLRDSKGVDSPKLEDLSNTLIGVVAFTIIALIFFSIFPSTFVQWIELSAGQ